MIEDKISESKFFLKKMNDEGKIEKPDLSSISYYYSAFLSASYSVYDYALHNANRVFKLGLADETRWDWRLFRSESIKQKNEGAVKYASWWSSRQQNDNNMTIGKAFSACRRINTHKRPTWKIGVDPKVEIGKTETNPDVCISIPIKLHANVFLQVEGFEQMHVEDACSTYLSTIEKFSEDHYVILDKIENEELNNKLLD